MPDRAVPETPRPRALTLLALLGVLALTLVTGCSTTGPSATGAGGYAPGDGSIRLIAAADRKDVPDLSGPLLAGGTAALSQQDGRVVVLNVWASWCGPCRKEAPQLSEAAKRLPDVGFLGINTRDTAANAEAFLRTQHVGYPSFEDQDGSLVLQLAKAVPMSALPTTVILDKEHRVAAAIYGPTTALTVITLAKALERAA